MGDWVPLSVTKMRHVLDQVQGPVRLPDPVIAKIAEHFLVPAESPVHFATQRRLLGATTLLSTTISAMRVCNADAPDRGELVHLAFLLSGSVCITPRGGEEVRIAPGDACVVSDWSAFDVQCTDGTRGLHIVMQKARLVDRGVHLSAARFNVDGARSLRAPLRSFALAVADESWSASTVGKLVAERTIEDLAVGMFLESEGYAMDSEDLRAGLRGRALSVIAATHRDVALTPSTVAARLSVSVRHLQRAFENHGQSVAQAIASRRAESAALLLVSPASVALTMHEIARKCGFSSPFELRAAFRDHYDMLPSEYRGDGPRSRRLEFEPR